MEINRRNALKASTLIPVSIGVCGMAEGAAVSCGANGIQVDPNILVEINKAVATGCNFIPAITTLLALITASFPALVGATTITDAVVKQIAALICAAAPTAAQHKLGGPEVKIEGTDVPVHGWVIQDGHLVYV